MLNSEGLDLLNAYGGNATGTRSPRDTFPICLSRRNSWQCAPAKIDALAIQPEHFSPHVEQPQLPNVNNIPFLEVCQLLCPLQLA